MQRLADLLVGICVRELEAGAAALEQPHRDGSREMNRHDEQNCTPRLELATNSER